MSDDLTVGEILNGSRIILLDFDGPVCGVFSGISDMTVAAHCREVIHRHSFSLPPSIEVQRDPLEVLRYAATLGDQTLREVEDCLRAAEMKAVAIADATPYAFDFIRKAGAVGKPIAIVSNNSAEAIASYLERHQLREGVGPIVGRPHSRPDLMKPDPWAVGEALRQLSAEAGSAVLVGDSTTDIEVAVIAGVRSIGFANKAGKAEALQRAGATTVVEGREGMAELVHALHGA
ncbi:hydrolase [Catellatospora methionotrophica]|uniref:Hydrolase n=1 Tax=Catellatospora methionotrophica TaxID=121620 RepID=A0A8J3PEL6_9ACTN|nr:HAD hydrolase-like protein [Catellatospora methionotrophica]GIG14282.1 hydrolase [Catellatospora methionotrophica]